MHVECTDDEEEEEQNEHVRDQAGETSNAHTPTVTDFMPQIESPKLLWLHPILSRTH